MRVSSSGTSRFGVPSASMPYGMPLLLSALLIHPHPRLQRIALHALSNTSWQAFEPVIEQSLNAGAFEGDLAKAAQDMLQSLRNAA